MDPLRIAVRAIVAYLFLLLTTRGSGKRVVTQATPFDFLVALIIGDLVDDALWAEVSVAKFGGAAGSIFLCDALVKLGAYRWQWFFRLVNGTPSVIVRDGHEDGHVLRREQLNEGDVAHLLRQQGIDDWSEVHLAVLDRGHDLSVIRRPGAEPVQKKDAQ